MVVESVSYSEIVSKQDLNWNLKSRLKTVLKKKTVQQPYLKLGSLGANYNLIHNGHNFNAHWEFLKTLNLIVKHLILGLWLI